MHEDTKWGHPLTYIMSYDHSDVAVQLDDSSAKAIHRLLMKGHSKRKEDPEETKQLEALQAVLDHTIREFWPHVLDVPWRTAKTGQATAKLKTKKTKVDLTVQDLLEKRWPLAWYWKALLTTIDQWRPSRRDVIRVRICQVRQWVMVLVYQRVNGKMKLLRPPLFGPSERLAQEDQYWLFLNFKKSIARDWLLVRDLKGTEGAFERNHVLGRHDVIYQVTHVGPVKKKGTAADLQRQVKVTLRAQLHLKPYVDENRCAIHKNIKKLAPTTKKHQIRNPYSLLRLPSLQEECREGDPAVDLLLSSDNVCRTVQQLSEIWNDQTAKSVFLLAPPGSGKDILAKTLYHFRPCDGEYVPYALSPDPALAELNQKMLFFRYMPNRRAAAEVRSMVRGSKTKRPPKQVRDSRDGLLFRARRGVLFLDEIDKEEGDGKTRAGLLRLLENDEFCVFGTTMIVSLPPGDIPLYVFAGSKPSLRDVLSLRPVDFWTRMTHILTMKHPLDVDDLNQRKAICGDYFQMFWNSHVPRFFERGDMLPVKPKNRSRTSKQIAAFLSEYSVGLFWALMDKTVVEKLSRMFAGIVSVQPYDMSIRNIRSVVGSVVFSLYELLMYDRNFGKPLAQIRERTATGVIKMNWSEVLICLLAGQDKWLEKVDKTAMDKNMCNELPVLHGEFESEIRGVMQEAVARVSSVR